MKIIGFSHIKEHCKDVACENQPRSYQINYRFVQVLHKREDVKYKLLC